MAPRARNRLLFLIAFAFLSVAGAVDDFGTVVLDQYVSVLIRVGFAPFPFANAHALADGPREATAVDTGRPRTDAGTSRAGRLGASREPDEFRTEGA